MVAPKSEKAPVEPRRPRHRLLLRAPDDLRHVAEDQHERVGEEELVELLLAVEVAEEQPLHDAAEHRDGERGAERRQPEPPRPACPSHCTNWYAQ